MGSALLEKCWQNDVYVMRSQARSLLLGEDISDSSGLLFGDAAVDSDESGVSGSRSVEDGSRCDSDASFDALEYSVEVGGFVVLEAAIHGAFGLDGSPAQLLLDHR